VHDSRSAACIAVDHTTLCRCIAVDHTTLCKCNLQDRQGIASGHAQVLKRCARCHDAMLINSLLLFVKDCNPLFERPYHIHNSCISSFL